MQVSNDSTDTRPTAPQPVDRIAPSTRLSEIEMAADFERCFDQAQAAADLAAQPADEAGGTSGMPDDAPTAIESDPGSADGESSSDGDDSDNDFDPRFSQPTWAAQTFGGSMPALDAAVMQQAHHAPAPQAWAEIAAQIERLLITDPAGRPDGAAALFRLAPELLRDTTVALSRTPQGWLLRIDSQDARLRVDSTRHEAALRERFTNGGLGDLVIEEGELPDPWG
jgi:hypothetical protein